MMWNNDHYKRIKNEEAVLISDATDKTCDDEELGKGKSKVKAKRKEKEI